MLKHFATKEPFRIEWTMRANCLIQLEVKLYNMILTTFMCCLPMADKPSLVSFPVVVVGRLAWVVAASCRFPLVLETPTRGSFPMIGASTSKVAFSKTLVNS